MPPAASAPTSSALPGDQVSVAVFEKDKLVACGDYSLTLPGPMLEAAKKQNGKAGSPLGPRELARDDLIGFFKGMDTIAGTIFNRRQPGTSSKARPKGEPQSLDNPCAVQFAGRKALSSCRLMDEKQASSGERLAVKLDLFYYTLTGDDRWMSGCLGAGGKWEEAPRDSLEYMRADHERLYRELKAK